MTSKWRSRHNGENLVSGLGIWRRFGGTQSLSVLRCWTCEVRCASRTLAVRYQAEMAVATHPTTARRMGISGYLGLIPPFHQMNHDAASPVVGRALALVTKRVVDLGIWAHS